MDDLTHALSQPTLLTFSRSYVLMLLHNMKNLLTLLLIFISLTFAMAQDGKILSKEPFIIPDTIWQQLEKRNPVLAKTIADSVAFFKISYRSDGLKVIGYIAEPNTPGKYPCIISNRGGNRDQSNWFAGSILNIMGRMASWHYVIVASQYRGNEGGEGIEEFGGADVHDVLNMIPVLEQLPNADTSRIGIRGASRGGMMTYLAMKATCRFKAAVVIAGMADAFNNIASRPDMETNVFSQLIPDYKNHKDESLKARSAVYWADQMCATTPLLIMHGSSDWRVLPTESFSLVQKLYEYKHPVRFILFEGADHRLSEYGDQQYAEARRFFDDYLRDGKKWPSMERHGN